MNHSTVASLARAVATELRMTAEHAEDDSEAWLTNGPERLRLCGYAGRIFITGIFSGTQQPAAQTWPEITVNASRAPAVIAREITRRLLPRYRAILAEVHARNAADAADTEARNATAATITAMFPAAPGHRPPIVRQEPASTVLHLDTGLGWGQVRITGSAPTIHLDLREVPAAAALRMLGTLAGGTADQATPCGECGQPAGPVVSAGHGPACSLHPSAIAS